MSTDQSSMEHMLLSQALNLRRVWTSDTKWLNKTDVLVLALLIQLTSCRTLVTSHERLACELKDALSAEAAFADIRILTTQTVQEAVGVCSPEVILDLPDAEIKLLTGIRGGLSANSLASLSNEIIHPLACFAPCLWHCGLAWIERSTSAPSASAPLAKITNLLASDWLDPLTLFEANQKSQSSAIQAPISSGDQGALQDRVQALEQMGLVRFELEAASAVWHQRWRT